MIGLISSVLCSIFKSRSHYNVLFYPKVLYYEMICLYVTLIYSMQNLLETITTIIRVKKNLTSAIFFKIMNYWS